MKHSHLIKIGLFALSVATSQAQEKANFFNDPFIQATNGIAACPIPPGPLMTQALQQLVRAIDDVEAVIDELVVKEK
jgi:hypothetical protein